MTTNPRGAVIPDPRHTRPLSQVEVEIRIAEVIDAMETHTEEFDDLAEAAAEAEADYKRDAATALVDIASTGMKMTVGERDARVELLSNDSYKAHLVATARRNAKREYLLSLRAHLDALRTLNASIRGQT
jgi:hypothetical protein